MGVNVGSDWLRYWFGVGSALMGWDCFTVFLDLFDLIDQFNLIVKNVLGYLLSSPPRFLTALDHSGHLRSCSTVFDPTFSAHRRPTLFKLLYGLL